MWNWKRFFDILMFSAGFVVVITNVFFFLNIRHCSRLAILKVKRPVFADSPSFWISMTSYCVSQNGVFPNPACTKFSLRPQYNIPALNVSTVALKAPTPSYFTTGGTLACTIISAISWCLILVAFSMKAPEGGIKIKMKRYIAIVGGIFAFSSFVMSTIIYITFCFSLRKVVSSSKDILNTKIKWGPGIPTCWGIFISFSIVMLLRVSRQLKQPDPDVELRSVLSNSSPPSSHGSEI